MKATNYIPPRPRPMPNKAIFLSRFQKLYKWRSRTSTAKIMKFKKTDQFWRFQSKFKQTSLTEQRTQSAPAGRYAVFMFLQ